MNMHNIIRTIVLLWILNFSATGQKTMMYSTSSLPFKKGVELFEKQKYGAARECFEQIIRDPSVESQGLLGEARYYAAMSAVKLYHKDAEFLVNEFISRHPESPRINDVRFEMAKYYYTNKKYRDASEWFEKVNRNRLQKDDLPEYWFKSGYCSFMRNELEKARFAFNEIKDVDTKYTSPALYYYSHIAYMQENYETALEGFRRLENDETFSPIVPYYIVQILYKQEKYKELIAYAPSVMEKVSEKRLPEVARMTGDAFYRENRFAEAIPYLERYKEKTQYMSPEDKYVLGFCYYKSNRYEDAVDMFDKISGESSPVQQNAMYHLADCYIRLNDKNKARMAFAAASKMEGDDNISEDALFNYAKLTYELSYSPFNEAIKTFNEYLTKYPASNRVDEAYDYLVQVYVNTKNYKDALASIQKIRNKDERIRKAWQRIAYFRGLELFNALDLDGAVALFDMSLNNSTYDAEIKALAWYWKGEAAYRQSEFNLAMENYSQFLSVSAAARTNVYPDVHYNIGYCYFNEKNYADAAIWFEKFLALQKNSVTASTGDALNRLGDCAFIRSNYPLAMEYYSKSITLKKYDTDYALFQKAFCLGLLNQYENKIGVLDQLLSSYPGSAYVDDALFELGNSYLKMQDQNKALGYYQKLITGYTGSSYIKKALVQAGLVYFNLDRNIDALDSYKRVIKEFPGSIESKSALMGIQTIYVEMGDADGYMAYVQSLGSQASVSTATQDSITYRAAENLYLTGDCNKSMEGFRKYIERFPEGNFVLNAQFYKGDCEYRSKQFDEALKSFNFVIQRPRSMFTEEALLGAARINFSNKSFSDASRNYKMLESLAEVKNNILEARLGMMRSFYYMEDWQQAAEAADRVLSTDKVSDLGIREARYILAKSSQSLGKTDQALDTYRKLAVEVKSVEGAEAKYQVARILFEMNQLDKAEKEIFDFIDRNTPHQLWMAKGFMLLSDIYVKKKDEFQAISTLQSIIDYYENKSDGIIEEAKRKRQIIEFGKPMPEVKSDTLEIDMKK